VQDEADLPIHAIPDVEGIDSEGDVVACKSDNPW
jgi:hypothetical protein